jgi:hypothetical protein
MRTTPDGAKLASWQQRSEEFVQTHHDLLAS